MTMIPIALPSITDAVIKRERQDMLDKYTSDLYQVIRNKLRAWIYTLRAKLPFVHHILQKQEVRQILDVISNYRNADYIMQIIKIIKLLKKN